MKKILLSVLWLWVGLCTTVAQQITIKADEYKQIYEGGGVSFGLYGGHFWSMSPENQEALLGLMYRDVNVRYIQRYFGPRPSENPGRYDKVAAYVKRAKGYRAAIKFSVVLNNFPEDLKIKKIIDGKEKDVLNTALPDIYGKLAAWYFSILQAFHDRGVKIDVFNMVNEPDWKKSQYYGGQDAKKGVAQIIQYAIPALKTILADPVQNPDHLSLPLIVGPSTLSPGGCLNYIKTWKSTYPKAWEELDAVGTHQYYNGDNWGKFKEIQEELEGRGFFQTEQHANKGDRLGDLPVSDPHRAALSLASLFYASVNNGVQSWFYFIINYPHNFHPGGLMQVAWKGTPKPYKHYYAFQQLNTLQKPDSHVLERTVKGSIKATVFRKKGDTEIVAHLANVSGKAKDVRIDIEGKEASYTITGLEGWQTDGEKNNELVFSENYGEKKEFITYKVPAYSLVSLELEIIQNNCESIIQKFDKLCVHPNPGTEIVCLEGIKENTSYQIINNLGRVVLEGNTKTININELEKGFYQLVTENGRTVRFIKK